MISAKAGCVTAVEYLLKQGASLYINDDGHHCDAGYNSLEPAASCGYSAIVKMIIETLDGPSKSPPGVGARPNVPVPDKEGMSPLAYAASAEQVSEMTQVLLDGGADPHHVDKCGRTPLSYTAMYSNLGMAQMLRRSGANPSHIDE